MKINIKMTILKFLSSFIGIIFRVLQRRMSAGPAKLHHCDTTEGKEMEKESKNEFS